MKKQETHWLVSVNPTVVVQNYDNLKNPVNTFGDGDFNFTIVSMCLIKC